MISYKAYFSEDVYDLIKNKSFLKELYKLEYNKEVVPKLYLQKIKDILLFRYPNTNVFLALKEGVPIAYVTGHVSNNKFILYDPIVSNKYLNKGVEEKLILKAINQVHSKKGLTVFEPSMISKKVASILKLIQTKRNKTTKVKRVFKKGLFSRNVNLKLIKKK